MAEPQPTKRRRILEAMKARAQRIRIANGFFTDAGERVKAGRDAVTDADTLPLVRMIVAAEPEFQGAADRARLRLEIEYEALARFDASHPIGVEEDLLGDLKRAVFLAEDRTLNGRALDVKHVGEGTTTRQEGGTVVAARVRAVVEYIETYGEPEA